MKRLFALAIVCGLAAVPAARADDMPSPAALKAAQELSAMVSGDTVAQMSAAMDGADLARPVASSLFIDRSMPRR